MYVCVCAFIVNMDDDNSWKYDILSLRLEFMINSYD